MTADRLRTAISTAAVRSWQTCCARTACNPATGLRCKSLVLYLAVLRAGAVYLPLNTAYTLPELAYFLGDAEPRLVVCDLPAVEPLRNLVSNGRTSARVEALTGSDELQTLMNAAHAAEPTFADVTRSRTDLAALLYTSGTTGRSKGAMLTHDNLSSNARTLCSSWQFTARDVLLHVLPIFHTHGLFVACNTTLMSGARMLFQRRFDADQAIMQLPRASVMMGVPTIYVRLLQDKRLDARLCANIRLFTSGSAPLLAETHRLFAARTGHAILERYGMTETNMITSNPYDGDRVAGSVGPPLPGIDVRITDAATGTPLPANDIGMIELKGPNVFPGYWRMEEKTREEFRPDGFFITGDLGRMDERGYVHILGRTKDVIISGGFNVYPKEIEAAIDEVEGVIESAVIGCAHPDLGEGVTAVVVRRPDSDVDAARILREIETRLARFKLPKKIIFAAELPRNTMGKVQKNLLRTEYAGLYA
jgi:malonyl-CoA/methylmalonyl-CoA synthetase